MNYICKAIHKYINTILDYEIVCYKHKYIRDISFYIIFDVITLLLSITIPLITKIRGTSYITAIIGSLVTVSNGLLTIFAFKNHYLLYKHIYKRLELEKYTFEYKTLPYYVSDIYNKNIKVKGLTLALSLLQDNVRKIIASGESIVDNLEESISNRKENKN